MAKPTASLHKKQSMIGWAFLMPATLLIVAMNFIPMLQALILSFQSGIGNNLNWSGISNYIRLAGDSTFRTALINNFVYLIIQVPIMLILAIILAVLLNSKDLKLKGLWRTAILLHSAGILLHHLQDAVCLRRLYQYHPAESGPAARTGQLAGQHLYGQDHPDSGADLALDRLQHGVLSGRAAEHRRIPL